MRGLRLYQGAGHSRRSSVLEYTESSTEPLTFLARPAIFIGFTLWPVLCCGKG